MTSQLEKANRFRELHAGPKAFVVANVWDAGSARVMAGIGFEALATSSGASAGVLGRRDGHVTREEAMMQARMITAAVDLPVSADLENGFGDEPEAVAETIRQAAAAGLVGCTIEDRIRDGNPSRYEFDVAVTRIAAGVAAARALPFPFTLTARTENFVNGYPDLDDTIKRLQAFERAGADVLMAPGLPTLEAVRTVCAAVGKPGQLHGRYSREVVLSAGIASGGRAAHQSRHLALSRGDERPRRSGARGTRTWHVRLSRTRPDLGRACWVSCKRKQAVQAIEAARCHIVRFE